ncbi:MAG TPA: beta-galactosidase [Clostridiaceae bacterium]|nr:beta-galactosidase [Clostridiaceae bacterium]
MFFMNLPRPEYPRPIMRRDNWINLNGEWEFELDPGQSGRERNMHANGVFSKKIIVPFCPESKLSGLEIKDFMPCVWYRRTFELKELKRTLIHFGAVDYHAEVWINGHSVGTHVGGYVGFTFDITDFVKVGVNEVVVCAADDTRSGKQPIGKQSFRYDSHGCHYTRTTGIWQTVWLEQVSDTYISNLKMVPDINNQRINITVFLEGNVRDGSNLKIDARSSYEGKDTGSVEVKGNWRQVSFSIQLSELHLWEPLKGRLYDLEITLYENDSLVDTIKSYFGMRNVSLTDKAILINGKPVFQRLILDQGYYMDGVYTAPSDDELRKDIERSIAMGFNGARLHEKVFEPRFLYWADKLGYLCWGEHANWGLDISNPEGMMAFLPEWVEILNRDISHPSIVGWCPFNETQGNQDNRILEYIYKVTREIDPTRPIIDTSGWVHTKFTDVYDMHDYDQDIESFARKLDPFKTGDTPYVTLSDPSTYKKGTPYFVSEFGGTWWAPDKEGWGYGNAPNTEEEFLKRFEGLVRYLLNHPKVCAFCYTQLTDVEQEVNGLYTYDRKPKFDPEIIRQIVSAKAAIEY